MSINNARTIEGLREMIVTKASETTLADSQYDYGHVNGWLGHGRAEERGEGCFRAGRR